MKKLKTYNTITFLLILIFSSIIWITQGSSFQSANANVAISDKSFGKCPDIYLPDIEKPGIVNIKHVQNLKLDRGTLVKVLSKESDGWWKVKINEAVAYIPNKSLEGYTEKTMKTASSLNLRKGIRKKEKIILSLAEKYELDAIEDLNKDIEYVAKLDFESEEILAQNKANKLEEAQLNPVEESEIEEKKKLIESKPEENLVVKSAKTTKHNVSVTNSKPSSASFVKTMYVTTSLNMRNGPGAGYPVIRSLSYNSQIETISKFDNGWYHVNYGDLNGYVSGKYLTETKAAPKPAPKPANKPVVKPQNKPSTSKYSAMKIYLPGRTVSYRNGGRSSGQSIIDANHAMVSTWGGAATFSGSDGLNTHFIGHNTNAFSRLENYNIGTKITVTDGKAVPTTYTVTEKFLVNEYGDHVDSGKYLFNYITGTGGGEVITLQTCRDSKTNWILRAVKSN